MGIPPEGINYDALKSRYLDLLQKILSDLDKNNLVNLDLVRSFNDAKKRLVETSVYQYGNDDKISQLVLTVDQLFAINIMALAEKGDYVTLSRKHVNQLLVSMTKGSYKPIYNP